ncbi:hypothetical protein Tco_1271523 [Tanacetum coccineum]
MKKAFSAWIGGKLIQLMHTTMVPEQVKTMKIQAEVQVSRQGELRRHLQLWKRFRRLYFIVIVLDRNIVGKYIPYVGFFKLGEMISCKIFSTFLIMDLDIEFLKLQDPSN